MKSARVVLLLTLAVGWLVPRPAYAHIGFWDWLEELSGPGPFKTGFMVDMRLFCFTQTQGPSGAVSPGPRTLPPTVAYWNPFGRKPSEEVLADRLACQSNHTVETNGTKHRVAGYFEIRGGRIWTDSDAPLFSDRKNELVGRTNTQVIQGIFMRQIDPAVAVGVGGGVLWFSGTNVIGHPTQAVLTPAAVAFMPLKLFLAETNPWVGFMTLRFDELAVLGHLTAQTFNPASTSSFESKHVDLVSSFAITFDLLAFRK